MRFSSLLLVGLIGLVSSVFPPPAREPAGDEVSPHDGSFIQGMTISCQTWGYEWGTDGFAEELDRLASLGVNWVAIHPYANIGKDGRVSFRSFDRGEGTEHDADPTWLTRPIREAQARGMRILVKPHLAYWGSPFSWRGEVAFEDPAQDALFWKGYRAWILELASACSKADAFSVGTELEKQMGREQEWRELISEVRERTDAQLSYCANWDGFDRVPFWDALDAIGVQAYFPVQPAGQPASKLPAARDIREAWEPWLRRLKATSDETGKCVFFGELGYDRVVTTAAQPWEGVSRSRPSSTEGEILQERCLNVAFEVMEQNKDWLRGAFLWKWFVGSTRHTNFELDMERTRKIIQKQWGKIPQDTK